MLGLTRTPALQRLEWIVDGLNGAPGWGADVTEVLSAEFRELIAPIEYGQLIRNRAKTYAPVAIIGVDLRDLEARARIRNPVHGVYILSCTVDPAPPHLITQTWFQPENDRDLTPRLPMDFTDHVVPARGGRRRLVVFSGLPGSGKSTLADVVGERLQIPVFSIDWLLGALTPFGGRHLENLSGIGDELLTTLAFRQLALGQSAILDDTVEDPSTRKRWETLAQRVAADFKVVACLCPDLNEHRRRVEGRTRGIPGWHDASDWANVVKRLAAFPPWDDALTIDTTRPRHENVSVTLEYIDR